MEFITNLFIINLMMVMGVMMRMAMSIKKKIKTKQN